MTNKEMRNQILHDVKRISGVMKLLQHEIDRLLEDMEHAWRKDGQKVYDKMD